MRDEVYDGREACLLHFVGAHSGVEPFMSSWASAGAAHAAGLGQPHGSGRNATGGGRAWNATDASGAIPVWGKCEAPTFKQDPRWDWWVAVMLCMA